MAINRRVKTFSPPLRVAWLTNYVAPYLTALFKDIADGLHEFRIFVSTKMEPGRPWPPEWDGLNVVLQRSVSRRSTWHHPHGFTEPVCLYFPYDTLFRLWRYQPDVVISGELGLRTLQAAVYRAFHPKSRLIVRASISECSEQGRGRLRELLRRWLLPRADAVIVHGDSGARYVQTYGVPNERIFRIPYSVENSFFCRAHVQKDCDGSNRLLYVGQLVARKGLLPFFSVLDRWAKSHPESLVTFWLVGDGPLLPILREFKLPSNVDIHFVGSVSYQDLPDFYSGAGILAFPTLCDEWGIVVNEAMACGVPVLGSVYSQAVEELVDEGVTGWVFRPDRTDEMYSALERALGTPAHALAEMRVAAHRRVETLGSKFAAERMLQVVYFVHS